MPTPQMSNKARTMAEFLAELLPLALECENIGVVLFKPNADGETYHVSSHGFELCVEQLEDCSKLFAMWARQAKTVEKIIAEACNG